MWNILVSYLIAHAFALAIGVIFIILFIAFKIVTEQMFGDPSGD